MDFVSAVFVSVVIEVVSHKCCSFHSYLATAIACKYSIGQGENKNNGFSR